MVASKSLPLYVKRAVGVFLTFTVSCLISWLPATDPPRNEIKNSLTTVVIDPGHGGKDPGAQGKFSLEKDITLKISLKLGKLIEENIPDVKVVYTRTTDVFPALHERAEIANKAEADLFISIHVNSSSNSAPSGTSSHVLGLHRTGENFDVAVRENSVILLEDDYETTYQGFDPSSDESYIIFSLMQNTYLKQSIEFASYVQDQFRDRSKRHDRGVVQQGLLVLARTSMPGVLIETGFISNPEEEKFLMSDYGQDLIASAIYRAFKQYKARIEENSRFTLDLSANQAQEKRPADSSIPDSLPENVIEFRVQIASSRNLIDTSPAEFKGHADVNVIEQGKWYKYVLGKGMTYHEALQRCTEIKTDFPDAFVVSLRNEKIIPLSEALLEINR